MKKTFAMLGTASVLALTAASAAQAGSIEGRVTDASQTVGLQGAIVRVVETGHTATVGRDGSFRIAGLDAGSYTLRVSYVGAETREITISLPSDDATADTVITLGEDVDFRENILVIGQRGAINSALSRQRADDGLVTVLSADAIGQFPDENVAEAARRAVGINVLNDQGEGRFVSIRGASPNLVSTSVNGVRLTSPEAEDRQVGLDVIDADVLSSVVINKSLLPNMDGDSVGGNVEIETESGLNVDSLTVRGRLAGLYSEQENEVGARASLNFANNFMDGRFGVAASLSYQERVFGSENIEVDGGWTDDDTDGQFFPGELEHRNYEVTRERTTAAANFDYELDSNTTLYLRTLYSEFSDQEYRSRVETKFEDGDFNSSLSDNTVVAFSSDGFEVDRDIKDRLETQTIWSADFGGEWFGNDTTIDWSLSFVSAEEAEPDRIDVDFRAEFEDGEVFAADISDRGRPVVRFGSSDDNSAYFDPSNYAFNGLEFTNGISTDEEMAARFNVRHDVDWFDGPGYIQYGLSYRDREKQFDLDMDIFEEGAGIEDTTLADFPRTVEYELARFGTSGDPFALRRFFNANRTSLEREDLDSDLESLIADYSAEEDVLAGYLMASVDRGPVRIAGGVRIEQTDFSATGFALLEAEEGALVGGTALGDDELFVSEVSTSNDYTDVLPSINVRWEASEDLVARFAYYGSIQRPNPGQVAPRIYFEQNEDNDVEGEFGNPDLERLEAENFDASLEWYPNNDSVFSIGYFYKDLENFIGDIEIEDGSFNGVDFDEAATFVNLPEGEISGWEFNAQTTLDDVLPVDGFLVGFNYTLTDSEAVTADGRTITLPGQADEVWNAILGYDNGRWDLRAVVTHRSEYLDEIRGSAEDDRIVLEHTQLDLSARYAFTDHLRAFVEVKNANDEPYTAVTRPNGIDSLEQFEQYGWSTVFGIRFNY